MFAQDLNRELTEAYAGSRERLFPLMWACMNDYMDQKIHAESQNKLLEAENVALRASKESHDADMKAKTDELEKFHAECGLIEVHLGLNFRFLHLLNSGLLPRRNAWICGKSTLR